MKKKINKKLQKNAGKLINFINESPTAFHAVKKSEDILEKQGFEKLNLNERWELKRGQKYFVERNSSALIAFVLGEKEIAENGFKMIGAHTDSPTFRIKPDPEIVEEDKYLKLNTEVYGGPILNTWFDRPLSIAGRVSLISDNPMKPESKLVKFEEPLLTIPNLAIHMNRKVNEGVELNKQKDLLPFLTMVEEEFEKEDFLISILAEKLKVKAEKIIDFDLFLYEKEKASIIGLNNEFISAGRQDDLAMVEAGVRALSNTKAVDATNVMVLFDNEEVGSSTKQGADSPMLKHVLERIVQSTGGDRSDFFQSLSNSFIISADMAHAVHPNYKDQHDPTNRPILNEGPVIKVNANQSYTSDSLSSGVFATISKNAGIPYQRFVNRSDKRGGSTIGPISATQIGIDSVDIGNPLLAMHSIRELGGVKDHSYLRKVFKEYYSI
mgnify:CR=1 FL=1